MQHLSADSLGEGGGHILVGDTTLCQCYM